MQTKFSLRSFLLSLLRYWWLWATAAGLVAVALIVRSCKEDPPVELTVKRSTQIDISPEEIRAIRSIDQWEFLSVTTEEMVEWHHRGTFSGNHLVRIYQGTLRLGVDLSDAPDDWFTSLPDSTARLRLPAVGLLDDHFIDEAATRSFYEKGHIPTSTRTELYEQARKAMLRRCLTPQNLKTAEENARTQFTSIFQALGFKKVEITFQATSK